jgi:hypothetical protein
MTGCKIVTLLADGDDGAGAFVASGERENILFEDVVANHAVGMAVCSPGCLDE